MKRCTALCLSILALFCFASPLCAEEFLQTDQITALAAAATVEKYPDSDDVLIDDVIQVRYRPDGTSEMWDDTAIKILTEKGKRDNRTLTLQFNTSYGTNYFTKVEVIKPDGSVQPVDLAANSKVMVDPGQMNENIYNPNSKILNLSVPGLEVGDTLRYIAHNVKTKTVVPDTWSDYQVFEGTTPIEHLIYRVIAPVTLPLRKIALKDEIPGTVSFEKTLDEEGDHIIYTWTVRDVPRMFDEPNMPTRYTVVQRLLVSTVETWEELSSWYWDLCAPRLEPSPDMEAKAQELTDGCTNTLQKVKAIFSFVSQDIRYMGITPEEEAPGYEPHDVTITFENRYGVCRDKAALLVAMLRLVDIEAFPVIIMAGPKKDEEVPQPFFNHAVTAALGDDGAYILMDSTDENTKDIFPSYLQNMSYLVARPEGETLLTSPIIPAEDNLLRITTEGSLGASGTLKARSTLVFEGVNDTIYRGYFSKIKPEERRRFFEGHLKKTAPTAELESLEISPAELRDTTHPLIVTLDYTADRLLIEGPENKMLNLPRLAASLGYANFLLGQTGLEKRTYPLYTRMTAGIRSTFDLRLPENLGTVTLPDYTDIDTEPMIWHMQVAQDGATLSMTNTFLLNAVEFSPEEYLTLKQNLKEIEYNLRKKLIIDAPGSAPEEAESDVRILEQQVDIVLEDADTWTETLHSKIQILTYAGKKSASEIKLPYNADWQEVEITGATVTLPDGTVKEIGEDEINLMDSPWVAAAPRYPSERILVANLPGVEIGSVLEYEILSRVDGKPFFSTVQTFNAHEPIDRKTVRLTAPETLGLELVNTGIAETKTASDGTITYTWTATNQPAVKQEEALPEWWTFNPTVFISAGNWKTYGSAVNDHLLAATQDQPATAALASQLTAGLDSKSEKAIALRNWVAENLRPAGPLLTSLPLSAITAADQTLNDRYGNNPDRMVVLYTMLKAAQFNPRFILSGGLSMVPEAADPLIAAPMRDAFDTVLIKVDIDGETVYLKGSSQYAELGTSSYNHRAMLDLSDGSVATIHVAPGKDDRAHTTYEMSIDSTGEAGLTGTSLVQGTAFERFHNLYAEMTPENRRRHYLELVSGISQSARAASDLITDYTTYPGTLEYSVHAPRYAVQDGDYLYFTVPGGFADLLKYRSNERTLPLSREGYVDLLNEYNIVLPDGYEPVILPKSFSWQAPHGAGMIEVAVEYSSRANAIRIVQIADLQPAMIPADDFPDIIEASRKLAHPDMQTILLRKKK